MNNNTLKYQTITSSVNGYANGTDDLPCVVVTYQDSWLYARQGRVMDYQDWNILVQFQIEQEVSHPQRDLEVFTHAQTVNWWFLPPHIKLV